MKLRNYPKNTVSAITMALLLSAFLASAVCAADKPNYWQRSIDAEADGNLDQALKEIYNYAAENGDRYLANVRAGWLSAQTQQYVQAKAFYEAAAKAAPAAITPRLGLAALGYSTKNWSETAKAAAEVLRIDPLNYKANLYAGEAAFQLRSYAEAVRLFEMLGSRYPEDTTVASWQGWSLLYLGEKRRAQIIFARLLEISPDYPFAAQGLAAAGK